MGENHGLRGDTDQGTGCYELHCECSVMSDSLQPHGLQPTRLLCPWDFPGKNTGVGYHFLLDAETETVSLESPALASMFLTWEDHVRIQRSVKLILAGGLRKLPGGTLY